MNAQTIQTAAADAAVTPKLGQDLVELRRWVNQFRRHLPGATSTFFRNANPMQFAAREIVLNERRAKAAKTAPVRARANKRACRDEAILSRPPDSSDEYFLKIRRILVREKHRSKKFGFAHREYLMAMRAHAKALMLRKSARSYVRHGARENALALSINAENQ